MSCCLVPGSKSFRVASILVAALTLSAWTCTAIARFDTCPEMAPSPEIASLSPGTVSENAASVLLVVNGSNFVPKSQILWNGSALQTTFIDSNHLQTTITQQTLDSFGGATGSTVLISVRSLAFTDSIGCPNEASSATLVLLVD